MFQLAASVFQESAPYWSFQSSEDYLQSLRQTDARTNFEEEMKSAFAIATPDDRQTAGPAPIDQALRDTIWPALATDKFSVVSVSDFALLEGITEQWADLAAQAVEANP